MADIDICIVRDVSRTCETSMKEYFVKIVNIAIFSIKASSLMFYRVLLYLLCSVNILIKMNLYLMIWAEIFKK